MTDRDAKLPQKKHCIDGFQEPRAGRMKSEWIKRKRSSVNAEYLKLACNILHCIKISRERPRLHRSGQTSRGWSETCMIITRIRVIDEHERMERWS